jgi:hypothetical protein
MARLSQAVLRVAAVQQHGITAGNTSATADSPELLALVALLQEEHGLPARPLPPSASTAGAAAGQLPPLSPLPGKGGAPDTAAASSSLEDKPFVLVPPTPDELAAMGVPPPHPGRVVVAVLGEPVPVNESGQPLPEPEDALRQLVHAATGGGRRLASGQALMAGIIAGNPMCVWAVGAGDGYAMTCGGTDELV